MPGPHLIGGCSLELARESDRAPMSPSPASHCQTAACSPSGFMLDPRVVAPLSPAIARDLIGRVGNVVSGYLAFELRGKDGRHSALPQ
jgi:hypothetical protein